jgi:AAA15 family ATPase/GTPase
MLIKISIENFRSFKDKVEFNMIAGDFPNHKDHLYKVDDSLSLLKGAAIYGANGAGKSNIVEALSYIRKIITRGTRDANEQIKTVKFKLDKDYLSKPTKFEIDFRSSNANYSYGLTVNENTIAEEWLYLLKPSLKHQMIFERSSSIVNGKTKNRLKFNPSNINSKKEEIKREIYEEELRHNQPFLYEGFNKNIKELIPAYNWFHKTLDILFPSSSYADLGNSLAGEDKFKPYINGVIKLSGVGISAITTETVPLETFLQGKEKLKQGLENSILKLNNSEVKAVEIKQGSHGGTYTLKKNAEGELVVTKLVTIHDSASGEGVEFDLSEESDGTQRLLNLIPMIVHAIEEGGVFVIDELDRSLHPVLIKEFIKTYFASNKPTANGQIIFTTHEDHLLDTNLLREDEIWFVEKDKSGASNMYSLSDFKPGYDEDVRCEYLTGKFGAIPFLGNLKDLNW